MNETEQFEIRFEDKSLDDAGLAIANLQHELNQSAVDVSVAIKKEDPNNQDFGATLILVLGTPAILAVAKGIASYLARHRGTISISKNGEVVATGISGDDAARIAEAFAQRS
jgi:hypothetical protein